MQSQHYPNGALFCQKQKETVKDRDRYSNTQRDKQRTQEGILTPNGKIYKTSTKKVSKELKKRY